MLVLAEDNVPPSFQAHSLMMKQNRITNGFNGKARIGVWKLEALAVKTVSQLLGDVFGDNCTFKRVRQPNGTQRLDLRLNREFYARNVDLA